MDEAPLFFADALLGGLARPLREGAARYAIERHMRPFTLCLHCNLRLEAVDKREVAGQVPASIAERYADFARCAGCGRIYWQGSHWERRRAMLGASLTVRF